MFSDMLLQIALDMGAKDGWITPTKEELSNLTVSSLVAWLIEHNPDKEHIIREKYKYFNEIQL